APAPEPLPLAGDDRRLRRPDRRARRHELCRAEAAAQQRR
ncbi:MAG: hypothetical protein AVDCRST_MAG67-2035, partial [uncultured Solirubrobacteraceae bacterium]